MAWMSLLFSLFLMSVYTNVECRMPYPDVSLVKAVLSAKDKFESSAVLDIVSSKGAPNEVDVISANSVMAEAI